MNVQVKTVRVLIVITAVKFSESDADCKKYAVKIKGFL